MKSLYDFLVFRVRGVDKFAVKKPLVKMKHVFFVSESRTNVTIIDKNAILVVFSSTVNG